MRKILPAAVPIGVSLDLHGHLGQHEGWHEDPSCIEQSRFELRVLR